RRKKKKKKICEGLELKLQGSSVKNETRPPAGFCFLDYRACVTTIAIPNPNAISSDPAPSAPPTDTIAARAAHIFGNRGSLTAFVSFSIGYSSTLAMTLSAAVAD
ncbi:hypothetical protein NGW74_003826, partial [Klebsiella pneumoniae]